MIYLGANQDAFAEGGKFGSLTANTMSYDPTNIDVSMAAAARSTATYSAKADLRNAPQAAAFTEFERKRARGDKKPKIG